MTGETAQHIIDALAPSLTVVVTWLLTRGRLDNLEHSMRRHRRERRRTDPSSEPWDGVKERRKSPDELWRLRP